MPLLPPVMTATRHDAGSRAGREVLATLQKRLGLNEGDVRQSASVLHDFGNVSSPFVLFVLERALSQNAPGGWWWMSTFGAGFSCHGAFLKVE